MWFTRPFYHLRDPAGGRKEDPKCTRLLGNTFIRARESLCEERPCNLRAEGIRDQVDIVGCSGRVSEVGRWPQYHDESTFVQSLLALRVIWLPPDQLEPLSNSCSIAGSVLILNN